jgi:hypothetical protein
LLKMKTCLLVLGAALLAAGVAAIVVAQPPAAPSGRPLTGSQPKLARPKPAAAPSITATDGLPVVGYLETRDRVIVIKTGSRGPVYTVQGKDGRVLHRNLSAQALEAKAPELYQLVRYGLAHPSKTDKVILDASVSRATASRAGR